ncbi:hypothetical protein GCM10018952_56760 [Streptosporangium vulgare]
MVRLEAEGTRQRPAEPAGRGRALNSQKGAGDAATWLPPPPAPTGAPMSSVQIKVKVKYDLWVTSGEKGRHGGRLKSC